ncbi:MAG: hemolysin D [Thiobacillus sp. 63-78]|uniref:HlyD family secretion protein n=1 Tax=Thiobacillus sp. 63-78 TaxID=1895859 RepID=UPI00095EEB71|nr:efflux RND transporter periplasmic adaptor subunit [Thiobacillus sp. 63-78]MBN8772838.1 efflux RND transporter periplasmic adaptor subunit [Thiobacillus sp.]OJZ04327.1 MAG: hemolysin D [Thiobacillus sp. 63-78]
MSRSPPLKKIRLPAAVIAIAAAAWWAWSSYHREDPGAGFVHGNGRLEATEVDVATRLPGRIVDVLVREGDFVTAGQPVARMQLDTLAAQRAEAQAGRDQARHAATAAEAQVLLRESDVAAVQAQVAQREAELDAASRRLARSQTLSSEGAASVQELDDDRARVRGAEAALTATRAQVKAAQAAVVAARAQVVGARSSVQAAAATIARIEADIRDSELKSPRDGRVQVIVAQPGEVLGGGGRVLNLLDLSDVYMTFFVPETAAGRIALGSEVRIVFDTAPGVVIPASVSFVASQAQFTPKTVETASERQKLMFRVRARIAPALLKRHIEQVKTGVPGVAWLKLDPQAQWPASLAIDPALLAAPQD